MMFNNHFIFSGIEADYIKAHIAIADQINIPCDDRVFQKKNGMVLHAFSAIT